MVARRGFFDVCFIILPVLLLWQEVHSKDGIVVIRKDMSEYRSRNEMQQLLVHILLNAFNDDEYKCLAVLADPYYADVFQSRLLEDIGSDMSYFMVVVKESEDLLSPNFRTVRSIKQILKEGCKAYIILIANGIQMARLLRFSDRYRVINTRARFILLHDFRLFQPELHYLWKRIINVIFIRRFENLGKAVGNTTRVSSSYELSTVPFPSPIRGVFVPKRVNIWRAGRFNSNASLFEDKTTDLNGQVLRVVAFQHVPAVIKLIQPNSDGNASIFSGLEVQALHALARAMQFEPLIYEIQNSNEEKWGYKQPDGSFNGLLGEIVGGTADIALGDLHYTPYHLDLMDLTIPYNTECLTFLTPESLTDNSWKTLILPFQLYMWIGVIVGLCIGGFIFYALAKFHSYIGQKNPQTELVLWIPPHKRKEYKELRRYSDIPISYYHPVHKYAAEPKPEGLHIFGDLSNSFLYTFGMLLVVSLPKLPTGWSLRMLTGWYWLYCVLVVVSYRASMISILANPAPRVTIDTVQELADSSIDCGGWGDQIRDFFQTSLDPAGQKIGSRFQSVDDPDEAVARVATGEFAYYDNQYFLKAISVKRQLQLQLHRALNGTASGQNVSVPHIVENERNLHIMSNCVIKMPISIGLQKNSPLKPRADTFLRRVIEAGLVEKWLNDVMLPTLTAEIPQDDGTGTPLMDLKKMYGALVAMGIGFVISTCVLVAENVHWYFIVQRKPEFDKYALKAYYKRMIKQ